MSIRISLIFRSTLFGLNFDTWGCGSSSVSRSIIAGSYSKGSGGFPGLSMRSWSASIGIVDNVSTISMSRDSVGSLSSRDSVGSLSVGSAESSVFMWGSCGLVVGMSGRGGRNLARLSSHASSLSILLQ